MKPVAPVTRSSVVEGCESIRVLSATEVSRMWQSRMPRLARLARGDIVDGFVSLEVSPHLAHVPAPRGIYGELKVFRGEPSPRRRKPR